jgi:hypothetical protein
MWLPRPVYESLPYAAAGAGLASIAAAFWLEWAARSLLFGLGGVLITVGLVLWMRRRDYRTTQSDYDPRAIDE